MEKETKKLSLQQMAEETLEKRPDIVLSAQKEYLDSASAIIDVEALTEKLKNPEFATTFHMAMIHTSSFILLTAMEAAHDQNPDEDDSPGQIAHENHGRLSREFLLVSQKDNKDIYDMKMFFFHTIDSKTMQISDPVSADKFDARIQELRENYAMRKSEFHQQ